jgi:glyoxylase-like metal-dependent hydrolase (beta-lactamase superfamily II)
MMARLSPLYPRDPVDISHRLQPLPEDGNVPSMPGWRTIHTPGHTVGHVSFFRDSDRALIVGDAFCTVQSESLFAIATQRPELHGPPAYYTPNWDEAKASVARLAELQPTLLIPGHGTPIHGEDVPQRLAALARDFDRIARPSAAHSQPAAGS